MEKNVLNFSIRSFTTMGFLKKNFNYGVKNEKNNVQRVLNIEE